MSFFVGRRDPPTTVSWLINYNYSFFFQFKALRLCEYIKPLKFILLGFFVTNASCCGVGTHNAYGCGLPNVHSKLCEYQRSYLFFDGRHNTEKAQESFGHLLFGADPNVIQPMNVRELIVYPVDEPMSEVWLPTTSAMVQASDSSSSASRGYEFYWVSINHIWFSQKSDS